jgi:hypothetical protein
MKYLLALKTMFCFSIITLQSFDVQAAQKPDFLSIRVSAVARDDCLLQRREPIQVCLYLAKDASDTTRAIKPFCEDPIVIGEITSQSNDTPNVKGKRISIDESVQIPLNDINMFRIALQQRAGVFPLTRFCPKRPLKHFENISTSSEGFYQLFDVRLIHPEGALQAVRINLESDIFEYGFSGMTQIPIVSCPFLSLAYASR